VRTLHNECRYEERKKKDVSHTWMYHANLKGREPPSGRVLPVVWGRQHSNRKEKKREKRLRFSCRENCRPERGGAPRLAANGAQRREEKKEVDLQKSNPILPRGCHCEGGGGGESKSASHCYGLHGSIHEEHKRKKGGKEKEERGIDVNWQNSKFDGVDRWSGHATKEEKREEGGRRFCRDGYRYHCIYQWLCFSNRGGEQRGRKKKEKEEKRFQHQLTTQGISHCHCFTEKRGGGKRNNAVVAISISAKILVISWRPRGRTEKKRGGGGKVTHVEAESKEMNKKGGEAKGRSASGPGEVFNDLLWRKRGRRKKKKKKDSRAGRIGF